MSKNILKSGWIIVNPDEETRVIDTNEQVAKRLEVIASTLAQQTYEDEEYPEGFAQGLEASTVDALLSDESEGNIIKDNAAEALQEQQEQLQQARAELENIREETEQMKQAALSEIEQMKQAAIEEGQRRGYEEGYHQGLVESEQAANEYRSKQQELERQYDEMITELEPQFINTLTSVYEQVFGIELVEQKQIVTHLLTNTMHKVEGSRSFIVHVAREDYPYVNEHKEQIISESATQTAQVEIIEDVALGEGQCIIETGGGIFDCGIDTQLKELNHKLKLLAWEPTK